MNVILNWTGRRKATNLEIIVHRETYGISFLPMTSRAAKSYRLTDHVKVAIAIYSQVFPYLQSRRQTDKQTDRHKGKTLLEKGNIFFQLLEKLTPSLLFAVELELYCSRYKNMAKTDKTKSSTWSASCTGLGLDCGTLLNIQQRLPNHSTNHE